MGSIRWRLAVGYTVALLVSLAGFGSLVYLELRRPSLSVLDRQLAIERDFAVNYLAESHRVLGSLVLRGEYPLLAPGAATGLQSYRDYLIVTDPKGRKLFTSDSVAALSFEALERLSAPLVPLPDTAVRRTLDLGPGRGAVRVLAVPVTAAGAEIGALLVAAPADRLAPDAGVFLRAMLVVAPVVVLASALVGYWLSARALAPVQGIIDEMAAITDGRSLHRRLAVPYAQDEIANLARTLNGMLARLEQSFAGLRRFTADASHELKTPLMVLRAGVERALTHPGTPTEALAALDETLEEINRMTELVEGLLTLARADEGRAPLAVERADLRELVGEAAETAGILGEPAEVAVTATQPAGPVWVMVDRRRIRELLLNLVTNAIKFTPAGGHVELLLAERPEGAVIAVRDSGIGIAAGDLEHVFERFWRADLARSRTGERPGTGLGLAISKWIAEAHGGAIAVRSRPGRGSTFTVTLPLAPDAEVLPPEAGGAGPAGGAGAEGRGSA